MVSIVFYVNAVNQYPKFIQQNKLFESVAPRLSVKALIEDARIAAWQVGLKSIFQKPIFGYGPENFFIAFDKFYDPKIPNIGDEWWDRQHNAFLEMEITEGIPALIIYFSLFVFFSLSIILLFFNC